MGFGSTQKPEFLPTQVIQIIGEIKPKPAVFKNTL
jgi:hypothetical protein